jgi:hypothetical protein
MANETTTAATSSFPFLSILTLIFITLKLTGYIAWSWWWVLSPLWIPLAIILGIGIIVVIIAMITGANITTRKRK